jgi:CO/xanthine dehydrogenase FAD-binding subunit
MKLPPFDYRTPESVQETVELLAEHGDDAKILAGGQSLLPMLALRLARPAVLIDINHVDELAGISVNGDLTIGALTRHRAVERSSAVAATAPMLAAAMRYVGHDAIRTRGTLGGSVAHADPAAEAPMVMRVLGGSIVATSVRGRRTIEADALFQGFLTTSLEPDELLTEIHVPRGGERSGWSVNEFSRRSGDFALVGTAIVLQLDGAGTIAEARIGLSGVAGEPVRATSAEAALTGAAPSDAAFAEAGRAAADAVNPSSDLHGTAAYRKHLVDVLVRRGLREALARAEGDR